MLSTRSPYNYEVDDAIVTALRKAVEPLRFNELHRRASVIFEGRIWIKTFNDHLKKLCEKSTVLREEKNRYHVTYRLGNLDGYTLERKTELLKELEAIIELPGGKDFFEGVVEDVKIRLRKLGLLKDE